MTHYFAPDPDAQVKERELRVELRGQVFEVTTATSVFSSGKLDPGTAVLLDHVPEPPADGVLVDLGCGWGPITLALASAASRAEVVAVDVSPVALEMTARNAKRAGLSNVTVLGAEEADAFFASRQVAGLWSNPPIRIGKPALHALLAQWLERLSPGALAHLVVAKNLGSDSLQKWLSTQGWPASRLASSKGFRVLEVASRP